MNLNNKPTQCKAAVINSIRNSTNPTPTWEADLHNRIKCLGKSNGTSGAGIIFKYCKNPNPVIRYEAMLLAVEYCDVEGGTDDLLKLTGVKEWLLQGGGNEFEVYGKEVKFTLIKKVYETGGIILGEEGRIRLERIVKGGIWGRGMTGQEVQVL
jgi:hypothetical protein